LGGLVGKGGSSYHWGCKKGLNSIIILGDWSIWKHQNDCVFNGAAPNIDTALSIARDETLWWCMAGAKGLSLLTAWGF
jgi:hypothetical protein